MNLTVTDATILLGLITAIAIPFVVTWLPALSAPSWLKWLIAAVVSLVAGFLTTYISGDFRFDASVIQNASVILTASQAIYYGAFKAFNLEAWLFPRSAVIAQAKDLAAADLEHVSTNEARAALDPTQGETLVVTAKVV